MTTEFDKEIDNIELTDDEASDENEEREDELSDEEEVKISNSNEDQEEEEIKRSAITKKTSTSTTKEIKSTTQKKEDPSNKDVKSNTMTVSAKKIPISTHVELSEEEDEYEDEDDGHDAVVVEPAVKGSLQPKNSKKIILDGGDNETLKNTKKTKAMISVENPNNSNKNTSLIGINKKGEVEDENPKNSKKSKDVMEEENTKNLKKTTVVSKEESPKKSKRPKKNVVAVEHSKKKVDSGKQKKETLIKDVLELTTKRNNEKKDDELKYDIESDHDDKQESSDMEKDETHSKDTKIEKPKKKNPNILLEPQKKYTGTAASAKFAKDASLYNFGFRSFRYNGEIGYLFDMSINKKILIRTPDAYQNISKHIKGLINRCGTEIDESNKNKKGAINFLNSLLSEGEDLFTENVNLYEKSIQDQKNQKGKKNEGKKRKHEEVPFDIDEENDQVVEENDAKKKRSPSNKKQKGLKQMKIKDFSTASSDNKNVFSDFYEALKVQTNENMQYILEVCPSNDTNLEKKSLKIRYELLKFQESMLNILEE